MLTVKRLKSHETNKRYHKKCNARCSYSIKKNKLPPTKRIRLKKEEDDEEEEEEDLSFLDHINQQIAKVVQEKLDLQEMIRQDLEERHEDDYDNIPTPFIIHNLRLQKTLNELNQFKHALINNR